DGLVYLVVLEDAGVEGADRFFSFETIRPGRGDHDRVVGPAGHVRVEVSGLVGLRALFADLLYLFDRSSTRAGRDGDHDRCEGKDASHRSPPESPVGSNVDAIRHPGVARNADERRVNARTTPVPKKRTARGSRSSARAAMN